jgi:hypothetical protein
VRRAAPLTITGIDATTMIGGHAVTTTIGGRAVTMMITGGVVMMTIIVDGGVAARLSFLFMR